MKIVSLLAGVAAVALTAGVASAQVTTTPTLPISNDAGTSTFQLSSSSVSASAGAAATSDGAEFNLSASVSQDCTFYSGGEDSVDIDFGTLGINNNASAGLDGAFKMTGPTEAQLETTTAGCNFASSVTIVKANDADGMAINNTDAFDENRFQNNLPYIVRANYRAGTQDANDDAARANHVVVGRNEGSDSELHGAWKSSMRLTFVIPVADKALVAGEYSDTVTVTLGAI